MDRDPLGRCLVQGIYCARLQARGNAVGCKGSSFVFLVFYFNAEKYLLRVEGRVEVVDTLVHALIRWEACEEQHGYGLHL